MQDFQAQKLAFLEYLSHKYPEYAYSIRSPGGSRYIMVSLTVVCDHRLLILVLVCLAATHHHF